MSTSRTFAKLSLSPLAYYEIATALRAAGYNHAFRPFDDEGAIDMQGIAVVSNGCKPFDAALATALQMERDSHDRLVEALEGRISELEESGSKVGLVLRNIVSQLEVYSGLVVEGGLQIGVLLDWDAAYEVLPEGGAAKCLKHPHRSIRKANRHRERFPAAERNLLDVYFCKDCEAWHVGHRPGSGRDRRIAAQRNGG
ncbi:MAG: hypothetical protein ACO1SV_21565 [Fimbriimonas sp.]